MANNSAVRKRTQPASGSARRTRAASAARPRVVTRGKRAAPADGPHQTSGASAPLPPSQPKRTLTPDNFLGTAAKFVASIPVLVPALVSPKTSAALREKIFLGVTSVNEARYCKWAHTHWAMDQGVPLKEVEQILGFKIESQAAENSAEAAAILFGQHYAELLDQIDPGSMEKLRKYYTDAQVDEVLAYVRFITFTNLLGNTADAFLNRLFEGVVGATAAPFALLLHLMAKFDSDIGIDALSPWRRPRPVALPNPDAD